MKKNYNELIWKKFEMLTIIKPYDIIKSRSRFLCKCDCWNEKIIRRWDLWRTKSCWCFVKTEEYKNLVSKNSTKHWMEWTRIYNIWRNIKRRCTCKDYLYYKQKWITYDKRWETFVWFYKDMGKWYSDNFSIDRIDNNWNYYKENCRWVDNKTQQRNKSDTVKYKWISLKTYCEENNLNYITIYSRIRRWMKTEQAINKPIIKRKCH